MGLCKCPKRKVTNQFCFEHRVNVCEHCMVQNHTKCVVQSYLAWLQDSDYNPNCEFCKGPLGDDDCVRLVCYHLYHWVCLDQHCRSLPPSTAPAGYTCPICTDAIFPSDNLVSPVADKLRQILQDVNWARAGLGLPLLEEAAERKPGVVPTGPRPTPEGESLDPICLAHELAAKKAARANTPATGWKEQPESSGGQWKEKESTVVQFDTPTSRRGASELADSSLVTSPLITGVDHDTDKYKRRAPTDWFLRWWRTMNKPVAQRRRLPGYLMMGLLAVLVLLSLVAVFHYFGRGGNDDPMLDPMNNPNIRVGLEP